MLQTRADATREMARVESTHLGLEDHGVYTVNVNFTGKGWGQGTGHHVVSRYNSTTREQHADDGWGMEFVIRMLQACSRDRWEDLPGALVWIMRAEPYGDIIGVEPLEVNEGVPFYFADLSPVQEKAS